MYGYNNEMWGHVGSEIPQIDNDIIREQKRLMREEEKRIIREERLREKIELNLSSMDFNILERLFFTAEEIESLYNIIINDISFTTSALQQLGFTYEQAQKLLYARRIAQGKVVIETKEAMAKHLRKMFGQNRRLSMQDLETSKIMEVPRFALVAGIKDEVYSIWNSSQYGLENGIYEVTNVSSTNITIKTDKKPVIKYKYPKEIEGVLEIKGVDDEGIVTVSINKDYIRLINRYMIVGSLKRPEFHHGLVAILCKDGTTVYIYAQTISSGERIKYKVGTQRVYDYGIKPQEIKPKILKQAYGMMRKIQGLFLDYEGPNQDYSIIERIQEDNYRVSVESMIDG